ncbi:MAG: oligosaccharide repeat unit polymerase [Clostridia bacterium]|nr:oligosaccharide repeat unit polymerase [Clostridia bacterium]
MAKEIGRKGYESNLINFILIVVAGMNVFDHGSIVLLAFAVLNLFFVSKKTTVAIDIQMIVLFLFVVISSVASFGFLQVGDAFVETIKITNYFTLYFTAKAGYQMSTNKDKYIKNTIFAMFLGVFINLALFYFYNLSLGGGEISGRFLVNIWTGEEIRATLIGLLSCVVVGYSFYGIFISKKIIVKLMSLGALVVAFAVNFGTATRTPLIMFFVVYLFLVFVILFSRAGRVHLKTIFFVLMFIVLIIALIGLNAFGLKDFIVSSPLYYRLVESGLETSRMTIVKNYFKIMPQNLWGGGVLSQSLGKTPHNLWQQVYDIYGLFPMVLMIVSTIQSIVVFVALLKQTRTSRVAILMVSVMLAMLLQCAMEPIITGFPILLWFLLMITGMANSWIEDVKNGNLPLSEQK